MSFYILKADIIKVLQKNITEINDSGLFTGSCLIEQSMLSY